MDDIRYTASRQHVQRIEEHRAPWRPWIAVAVEAAALACTLYLTWNRL